MKNFRFYTKPVEVRDFVLSTLQTEEMKSAFMTQPSLRSLLDQYCRYPRLTFEATDPLIERGNFTSWYNALALRKYENPAVNDLFYLHEIAHIATMAYLPEAGFEGWKRKMFRNELEASVLSEAFIYFLSPALRARSFRGEIWVDRFKEIGGQKMDDILNFLLAERDRIQRQPNESDEQERRIYSYQRQNEAWATIWSKNFSRVEKQMNDFYRLAAKAPSEAVAFHTEWLQTEISAGGKPYPFPNEVENFADYCAKDKTAVIPSELNLKKTSGG